MTHRFINADGLVSTGTGILGHNMFAYCDNNPVNHYDPSGERIYYDDFIGPLQPGDILVSAPSPFALFAEHHKKGTTNPSNKNKHQKGQKRKQSDKFGGEKGDARRKVDRSNKRHFKTEIQDEYAFDKLFDGFKVIGATIMIIYVVANDISVVGVTDDYSLTILVPILWDSAKNFLY